MKEIATAYYRLLGQTSTRDSVLETSELRFAPIVMVGSCS